MDNNESKTQTQEISQEVTPAQETTTSTTETTQSTQQGKPEEVTTKVEEWEYDGNRSAVPEPFKKYAQGFDRYVSKKDQAAAEFKKKAEEYDKVLSSNEFKEYQQFIANRPKNAGSEEQRPTVTQEEIDAITLGDAKTLEKVIERKAKELLDTNIGPKEQEMRQQLAALTMKQKQIENAEMIQSFAEVNKDFWDLYDSGLEDYIVTSIKSGRSLEETYKAAKTIESKMIEKVENKRQNDMKMKKDGTVVGKSIPGTPDVVFADNEDHAKRLAIELTLKGDKRHVRIKPKK